jgi:hypothetical protein
MIVTALLHGRFWTKILGTQNATMKGIYELKKKSLNPEHLAMN